MKNLSCMMRITLIASLAVVLLPIAGGGQDLEGLASGASSDLQKALAELSAARKEVEAERLPLARQVTELEQKLAERKSEMARAQRLQENQLVELNALKAEAKRQADEVKFIESLLTEYAKSFRSRLAFIEEPRYQGIFESVEKAATAADLSPAERFTQRAILLTTSLKRNEAALGGEIFDGKALDKSGRVQQGKVALIGPVAMFAAPQGDAAGLLQQELNRADPTVVTVDEKVSAASRALVTSGTGQLALDPTLGNAFKLSALKETLYEKIAKGGWVMAPLLGLGAAMLLVALVKWLQLTRIRLATEKDLQKVLRHLGDDEPEKALAHARSIPGVAGDMLATAVEHADEKKEYIEEVVYEKMLGARTRLERGIAFLALTATAGPLLGLLGTVMGMISTFKLISSFGSGDPKLLAAGISEALIATATGMSVAIPALLLHALLSRKAKGVIGSMEQTAVGFINGVPEKEKAFA
jgi:biopolymer transport protein ExbB